MTRAMATGADAEPRLGCSRDELDTPALCVDLDVMEENIRRVAASCATAGVAWRPHVKGHRAGAIGAREVAAGAIGLTCAKLGEAEVMAAAGVRDLLVANAVVGPQKLARLVELARHADPIVAVDHGDQLVPLSVAFANAGARVRVVIEVDIGMGRAGVEPGASALQLARQAASLEGIELAGLMGWEGHLLTIADRNEKARQIHDALDLLVGTAQLLEADGLPCPIVSSSGTGSFQIALDHPGVTEIQAGGAILMDVFYRDLCGVVGLDDALTLLATVVGRPTPERAIVDAGRKTLNVEIATPRVIGRPGVEFEQLSAEHGQLRVGPAAAPLSIGERLEIVPGYADLTVVLHDRFYGFRDGRLDRGHRDRGQRRVEVTALLALLSAVFIGGADFVGGLTSRTANGIRVAAFVAVAGLPVALVVSVAYPAERVTGEDVLWAALAGIAVALGLGSFYLGMGRGLISIVAPVAAVTGAVIPVAYALVRGERPGPIALIGLAIALVALAVVTLAPSEQHEDALTIDRIRHRARALQRPHVRAVLHRVLAHRRSGRALADHDPAVCVGDRARRDRPRIRSRPTSRASDVCSRRFS